MLSASVAEIALPMFCPARVFSSTGSSISASSLSKDGLLLLWPVVALATDDQFWSESPSPFFARTRTSYCVRGFRGSGFYRQLLVILVLVSVLSGASSDGQWGQCPIVPEAPS